MKNFWSVVLALFAALSGTPALASSLPAGWSELADGGRQKVWHATLDLRSLPANTRPASIVAIISLPEAITATVKPRITIALNGVVIARRWPSDRGRTAIRAAIEDRLLSTRNHVALAVTFPESLCADGACDAAEAALDGTMRLGLEPATAAPLNFAEHVTRFRSGVAVEGHGAGNLALAELAAQAIAPLAPRSPGAPARIIVSRTTPLGVDPSLRFDTGPVEIEDRDGHLIYDERQLNALTIVQMTARGDTPVLWVRPGLGAPPRGPLELDYGRIALFGPEGREISFSREQDQAAVIVYAYDAAREAQVGLYWRLAILAVWLAASAGLVWILRRMPPMQPAKAA
jgi:hypothetical protein